MQEKDYKLFIAVSSRALFDLEEENQIFKNKGVSAYQEHQIKKERVKLKKGGAFHFIEALLKLNKILKRDITEVMIVSKNSLAMGIRIFNSIKEHKLPITRAAFLTGESVVKYLTCFKCDLFLSKDEGDVREAIKQGLAAARIYNSGETNVLEGISSSKKAILPKTKENEIRIAFDGDAVIFSKEAEEIYQKKGLEAFLEHEEKNAKKPLPEGPFAKFLKTLTLIQRDYSEKKSEFSIKIALVTARSSPALERVIRTFRIWEVEIDNAFFLGGFSKSRILEAFNPHIYFDDQQEHLDSVPKELPSGQVFRE